MKRIASAVAIGAALAASLAIAQTPPAAMCNLTLAANIQPILNTYCVVCHQDLAPAEMLSLQRGAVIANTVNVKSQHAMMNRITPGSAEMSYLLFKLAGTQLTVPGGFGEKMPLGGELPAADLATLTSWIVDCMAAG